MTRDEIFSELSKAPLDDIVEETLDSVEMREILADLITGELSQRLLYERLMSLTLMVEESILDRKERDK